MQMKQFVSRTPVCIGDPTGMLPLFTSMLIIVNVLEQGRELESQHTAEVS
jgi:hypothetical protein